MSDPSFLTPVWNNPASATLVSGVPWVQGRTGSIDDYTAPSRDLAGGSATWPTYLNNGSVLDGFTRPVLVNPVSLPAAFQGGESLVEFPLVQQSIDVLTDLDLALTVTMSACTVNATPFLVNRVETWGAGGQIEVAQQAQLYAWLLLKQTDEAAAEGGQLNMTDPISAISTGVAAYTARTTTYSVANSNQVQEFVVPINIALTQPKSLYIPGLVGDLRLRIYLAGNPSVNGTGTMVLNSAVLRAHMRGVHADAATQLMTLYRSPSSPIRMRCIVPSYHVENLAAYTSGTTYQFTTRNIAGLSAGLIVDIVPQTTTVQSSISTRFGISNLQLLNSAGGQLTPVVATPYNQKVWSKAIKTPYNAGSWVIPFSTDLRNSMLTGAMDGFRFFDRSQQIAVTSGSSQTNVWARVTSLNYAYLQVSGGNLSLIQTSA